MSLFVHRRMLVSRQGWRGFAKDLIKLVAPGRMYACFTANGKVTSDCYVTLSRCRHYPVEKGAAVLGPVWTAPEMRGHGLATALLKRTMNRLMAAGCCLFYVDTSDRNTSMQKVIARCGFGPPVDSFEKTGPIR
ncbi:MAG: GNAT family N-acetyltransferase [Kiritimatiellae bacterium]|nr:GNAT family N-acetyltransferase [Kiritimatiellia bacterium]